MPRRFINEQARRFAFDCVGNLAYAAAVALPIALGGIGVAFDYMRMVNEQRLLQDALDTAAVSSAASLAEGHHDAATVKDYAINLVMTSVDRSLSDPEKVELKSRLAVTILTTTAAGKKTFDVNLSGSFSVALTPFSQLLGFSDRPVSAVSSTASEYAAKKALSMFVVLDRSGSMSFVTETKDASNVQCQNYTISNWAWYPDVAASAPCYVNKIGALKMAATSLFDEFERLEGKDPRDSVIRLGGVSFTDTMQAPTDLSWDLSVLRGYVDALPAYPTGGTDMSGGMASAYQSLVSSAESDAHAAAGNAEFAKFIVLMSDGENTGASSTWNANLDASTRATCEDARNSGITIYTVAFMAPANGEALLRDCAGQSENFYSASDMQSLVKAFEDIGTRAVAKATRIVN